MSLPLPSPHHVPPAPTAGSAPSVSGRVVVVEDDPSLRDMLATVLVDEGHDVVTIPSGERALTVDLDAARLVVLDLGLPGVGGIDVCSHLRRRGSTVPVLMLTARAEVQDRVRGLDAGADDYVTKPFALDEFLARVRALVRRSALEQTDDVVEIDDLVVDAVSRTAVRGGEALDLTRREFDLLHLLVSRAPAVVEREQIHREVWNHEGVHLSNSMEVFISALRRKTEARGRSRLIHTVRGVGYSVRSD